VQFPTSALIFAIPYSLNVRILSGDRLDAFLANYDRGESLPKQRTKGNICNNSIMQINEKEDNWLTARTKKYCQLIVK
jgi:hypothetical protein